MKIGVSSYSFNRYLKDGRLDLFGVVGKAAEMGFEGMEFVGLGLDADDPGRDEQADKLKEACAAAGLPITSYTIGADFLRAEGGWEAEVDRLHGEVDMAARLGAPCMRHDATRGFPEGHANAGDFPAALETLAPACRAVAEYAAGRGVRTTVENHGHFVQASERCEALMQAVDHENFGALIDIGNFLCVDEPPVAAVTRMAPHAFYVHAKDFHTKPGDGPDPGRGWMKSAGGNYLRGAIVGHGNVDVPACLAALKGAGYDGTISIEFEGIEDNLLALEIGLENLRRYLTELG